MGDPLNEALHRAAFATLDQFVDAAKLRPAPDAPLVDPETGETPPLSPQRRPTLRGGPSWPEAPLVFVVDPAKRRAYIEGSWDVTEPDDAA